MRNILWLPSWYPNKLAPFNGDFIQRHAKAVSLFLPVTVICLVKDEKGIFTNDVHAETSMQGELYETIVYYKPFTTGIGLIDKLMAAAKYLAVAKKYIGRYIEKQGKPVVIHVHVPFKAGMPARWYKKKLHIPFIVTEHWCGYNNLNPDNFLKRNASFRRLTKKTYESADLVTMVCESNRKELTGLFNIHKSVIIHNTADASLFYYQEKNAAFPFTFVHVSSMGYQKNVEGILNALAICKDELRNWRCIIIGPYSHALTEQAKQLGLEQRLVWAGEVPYEKVALHVRAAQCMIMFSRFENSPCTIIEALTAGVPVIASAVGGIPEIIDESNGLLVPSENNHELALAIVQMVNNYEIYQPRQIAAKAKGMFSYEATGAQIAALYKPFIRQPDR